MNKLLFVAIFSLSLSLLSCGENKDPDSKYKINKNQFNTQCNRDYVLVKSNYTIKEFYPYSEPLTVYFDYGKIKVESSLYSTFYKVVLNDDSFTLTRYPSYGGSYDETISKQEMYNFFFGQYDFLFDVTYESLTFNKEQKCYDVDVSIFDSSYQIEGLSFFTLNGVLQKAVASINKQSFIMDFYDIGSTKVDIQLVPSEIKTLKYDYNLPQGANDKMIIDYVSYCLSELGIKTRSVSAGSGKLAIEYTTSFGSIAERNIDVLLHKKIGEKVALTNAHDEEVFDLDFQVNPRSDAIELSMLCSTNDVARLINTTVKDMNNGDTNYAIMSPLSEDEEENKYGYPIFIWADYDREICNFNNYKNNEVETLLRVFGQYFFYPDTFKISDYIVDVSDYSYRFTLLMGYMDSNGDGYISEQERNQSIFQASFIASYINIENYCLQIVD